MSLSARTEEGTHRLLGRVAWPAFSLLRITGPPLMGLIIECLWAVYGGGKDQSVSPELGTTDPEGCRDGFQRSYKPPKIISKILWDHVCFWEEDRSFHQIVKNIYHPQNIKNRSKIHKTFLVIS